MPTFQWYLARKRKFSPTSFTMSPVKSNLVHLKTSMGTASKLAAMARDLDAFHGVLPPIDTPVSLLLYRAPPTTTSFRQWCLGVRDRHLAAQNGVATSKCLASNQQITGASFVPAYYFSGMDPLTHIFVIAVQRVVGRPMRAGYEADTAKIERALVSLWITGIDSQHIRKTDVFVNSQGAMLVDFAMAGEVQSSWRRTKAANTLSISETSKRFSEWAPPSWLALDMLNTQKLANARRKVWAQGLVC